MQQIFSDADHTRVADAIRSVEARTAGQIVCVVAARAEPYAIIAGQWSALAGLIAGAIAAPFWTGFHLGWLIVLQFAVALAAFGLLQIEALRMRTVPRQVKHRRAARLARSQFLEQGVHRTEGRTGILIFAAMAEHYVEIIADEGVHARVDPALWAEIVANFTTQMKRGETIDAFVEAIAACGTPLTEHFPAKRAANELPDHLIEIV